MSKLHLKRKGVYITDSTFLSSNSSAGSSETSKNQLTKLNNPRNLYEAYSMTDTLHGEKLPEITRNIMKQAPKQDRKTYKNMPLEVTVYRGCELDEMKQNPGQSWTTNIDIARHFAWVHYVADKKATYEELRHRVVLKATIKKKDIYAYMDIIRNEKECVVNPNGLVDIEIADDEYSIDKIEILYNKNLYQDIKRHKQTGHTGLISVRIFDNTIKTMDIDKMLSFCRNLP